MNTKIRFAGDINIKQIQLTTLLNGTKIDITPMVIGVNIYEDIFSPFVSGTLVINDSLDLMNAFPFIGQEFITMNIFTPTLDETGSKSDVIDQVFFIHKISNRTILAERNVVYEMHFFSQELAIDSNLKISKSFSGLISDIARDIIGATGLATSRIGYIEETANNTKYISNYWTPSKNMNFLANAAISKNGSPSFLFFENRTGFNFVSIDTLSKYEPIQTFTMNSFMRNRQGATTTRDIEKDYKRINELHIPHVVDSLSNLTSGAFASTLITYDLTSKRYRVKEFNYLDGFEKESHLNQYPIGNNSTSAVQRPLSKIFTATTQYGVFNNFGNVSNVAIVQNRVYRLLQIENHKVKIVVPGRTDYTVGKTVNLDLYQNEALDRKDGIEDNRDKVFSGKYLISAIHHSITRERHECVIELIKDTFIKNLSSIGEA